MSQFSNATFPHVRVVPCTPPFRWIASRFVHLSLSSRTFLQKSPSFSLPYLISLSPSPSLPFQLRPSCRRPPPEPSGAAPPETPSPAAGNLVFAGSGVAGRGFWAVGIQGHRTYSMYMRFGISENFHICGPVAITPPLPLYRSFPL